MTLYIYRYMHVFQRTVEARYYMYGETGYKDKVSYVGLHIP